jgi:hypothetical protein
MCKLELYQGDGIKYKGWNYMYGMELIVWAGIKSRGWN